jgi:thiol-disulfide isomerase/thioredoxin
MRIRFAVYLLALLLSVQNVSAQQTAGLPKAVLYDKAGRQIATSSISDFDNPIIIVTYSESWCTPCVDLISKFDRNYATSAKNSSVKIIAVNVDKSLASTDVFTKAKRWTNIEVLHDKYGDFQTALYTTRAPSVLFMNDHQQVIHTESTYNLDVAKAYKLADQLKRNLINAEKIYFDKDWFPVPDAEGMYYRQLKRNGDNDWEVNDYFKNGQLQMVKLLFPIRWYAPVSTVIFTRMVNCKAKVFTTTTSFRVKQWAGTKTATSNTNIIM